MGKAATKDIVYILTLQDAKVDSWVMEKKQEFSLRERTQPYGYESSVLYLGTFMFELLKIESEDPNGRLMGEEDITERILTLGHCKDQRPAMMTAKTIIFLGLLDQIEIPASCQSAFDVVYFRMEERLSYSSAEKDMVLLHQEVEIKCPYSKITEKHRATLLEFGKTLDGETTTAMALTVGILAAIEALLLLTNKIQTRGVLRWKEVMYFPYSF